MSLQTRIIGAMFATTERDQQTRIGPSNLSTTCARCLADAMLGTSESSTAYELTSTIGTALHEMLEERVDQYEPDLLTERKVTVGEVPGYGTIKGTADLFDPSTGTVVDYKTTTRTKARQYKNAYTFDKDDRVVFHNDTLHRHYRQAHLYAHGYAHHYDVDQVAILYIPRDGHNRSDLVWLSFPYDDTLAPQILATAGEVYDYARRFSVDDVASNPDCFTCSTRGPFQ